MKFEIVGRPEFRFSLTLAQIGMLIDRSSHHYDMVCRAASAQEPERGFLRVWDVCTRLNEGYVIQATWRQLDTCLKVLEYPPFGTGPEEIATQRGLFNSIHKAMNAAMEESPHWVLNIDIAE